MRWTVFLRCESNIDTNTEVPLLSLERDSLPDFAQLGLIPCCPNIQMNQARDEKLMS